LRIVAVGNRLIHQINGITTVDVTDDHPEALKKGILALQLHAGPPMRVEFRNLRLRSLTALPELTDRTDPAAQTDQTDPTPITGAPLPSWIWAQTTSGSEAFLPPDV